MRCIIQEYLLCYKTEVICVVTTHARHTAAGNWGRWRRKILILIILLRNTYPSNLRNCWLDGLHG